MPSPRAFISCEPLLSQTSRFAVRVRDTVTASVDSFILRDAARAAGLLNTVDFEHEVAEECRKALAVSFGAPPADVLRALKLLIALGRVGSLSVGICKRTIELGATDATLARDSLDRLATMVKTLLRDALGALGDDPTTSQNAAPVSQNDVMVDACHAQSLSELSLLVYQDARNIDRVLSLRAVGRALERIDDEAREIATELAAHLDEPGPAHA
jgi:phosphate uptake regulator